MSRIYIDSCVLIGAWRGEEQQARIALEELERQDVDFLYGLFLEMEVLSKPIYFKNDDELQFYDEIFFSRASRIPEPSKVLETSFEVAKENGLSAGDGVHLTWAAAGNADEFVTMERKTKLASSPNSPVPIRTIAIST